jgi:hypothetical protein
VQWRTTGSAEALRFAAARWLGLGDATPPKPPLASLSSSPAGAAL